MYDDGVALPVCASYYTTSPPQMQTDKYPAAAQGREVCTTAGCTHRARRGVALGRCYKQSYQLPNPDSPR
jgi:hypothetical protein